MDLGRLIKLNNERDAPNQAAAGAKLFSPPLTQDSRLKTKTWLLLPAVVRVVRGKIVGFKEVQASSEREFLVMEPYRVGPLRPFLSTRSRSPRLAVACTALMATSSCVIADSYDGWQHELMDILNSNMKLDSLFLLLQNNALSTSDSYTLPEPLALKGTVDGIRSSTDTQKTGGTVRFIFDELPSTAKRQRTMKRRQTTS